MDKAQWASACAVPQLSGNSRSVSGIEQLAVFLAIAVASVIALLLLKRGISARFIKKGYLPLTSSIAKHSSAGDKSHSVELSGGSSHVPVLTKLF